MRGAIFQTTTGVSNILAGGILLRGSAVIETNLRQLCLLLDQMIRGLVIAESPGLYQPLLSPRIWLLDQ